MNENKCNINYFNTVLFLFNFNFIHCLLTLLYLHCLLTELSTFPFLIIFVNFNHYTLDKINDTSFIILSVVIMFLEFIKWFAFKYFCWIIEFSAITLRLLSTTRRIFFIIFNQRQILQNGPKQIYHEKIHLFMSVKNLITL